MRTKLFINNILLVMNKKYLYSLRNLEDSVR